MRIKLAAVAMALGLAAGACSSDQPTSSPSSLSPSANLPVQVALVNYELVASAPNRFMVGLVLPDNRMVAYGSVQMRFQALDVSGQPTGSVSEAVTGTYLPVPGTDPGDPAADPQAISPATARGAYELEGVRFGGPGRWVAEVAARVQDVGVVQGSVTFDVLASPKVPGVGEQAPASDNAVIGDPDVDPVSIDSRAHGSAKIPDPELHRVSIADAIGAKRPAVIVFSTPVFCVSRFCGPVTDMVASLAATYGGRAEFIHVEVWKDFQNNLANDAANEWLLRDGTLNEPWAFILDKAGRIVARWDNLFTRPELEEGLKSVLKGLGDQLDLDDGQ
jgi:hypothetical protein